MKFRFFFKKGEGQQRHPSEENASGPSQEDQIPHRRRFRLFNSKNDRREQTKNAVEDITSGPSQEGQISQRRPFRLFKSQKYHREQNEKAATHNRTESNETSITQNLTLNESYSAEGQAFVEEANGSYEVLSPNYPVQYGKSLLELDAAGGGGENSHVEGLSSIMEEISSSGQKSPNSSAGKASREVSPDSSTDDEDKKPFASSTRPSSPPRMIQMDGSIVQHVGESWVDSFSSRPRMIQMDGSIVQYVGESLVDSFELCNRVGRPQIEDQPRGEDGSGNASLLDKESTAAQTVEDGNDEDREHRIENELDGGVSSPTAQTVEDGSDNDLEGPRVWIASDGTPRFLA